MTNLPKITDAAVAADVMFQLLESTIANAYIIQKDVADTMAPGVEVRMALYECFLALRRTQQRLRDVVIESGADCRNVPDAFPPYVSATHSTPSPKSQRRKPASTRGSRL